MQTQVETLGSQAKNIRIIIFKNLSTDINQPHTIAETNSTDEVQANCWKKFLRREKSESGVVISYDLKCPVFKKNHESYKKEQENVTNTKEKNDLIETELEWAHMLVLGDKTLKQPF
jgi:hypothetical protein